MPKIYALLKFFKKKKYANDFIKGKLYSNNISFFKNIEDKTNTNRNDKYEAVCSNFQAEKIILTLNNHLFTDIIEQITIQKPYMDSLNIFCMYAIYCNNFKNINKLTIEELNKEIKIDNKCLEFGDYAVVITNIKEFIDRIKCKVQKEGYSVKGQLIDYYNPSTFHGTVSEEDAIFRKRDIYKHQKEYRFVFETNLHDKPLKLDIGDISDITMSIKTKEINNTLKIM